MTFEILGRFELLAACLARITLIHVVRFRVSFQHIIGGKFKSTSLAFEIFLTQMDSPDVRPQVLLQIEPPIAVRAGKVLIVFVTGHVVLEVAPAAQTGSADVAHERLVHLDVVLVQQVRILEHLRTARFVAVELAAPDLVFYELMSFKLPQVIRRVGTLCAT